MIVCRLLGKTDDDKLYVFEKKVLRKICGTICDHNAQVWRKKYN